MKTKFLLFSAIIFLLLGRNAQDGVLFFFFAIHLFTLFIGVFFAKYEKNLQPNRTLYTPPDSDSAKS